MNAEQFTFWLKGYIAAGGDANSDIVKGELEKVTTPSVYIGSQWLDRRPWSSSGNTISLTTT
jgi:hypothetical protein